MACPSRQFGEQRGFPAARAAGQHDLILKQVHRHSRAMIEWPDLAGYSDRLTSLRAGKA
jgi:hypothetical protein